MTTVLVKKYNPLEMSEEDVLALATGREKLLDIMLSEMKVCLKKGSNQHFVLHGPRGIGKSFFTRLLKIHHDQSDDFKNSLFLQLPEEQENINFAADLMDVIATLLEGGKLIDTAPKWTISDNQWQKSKQRLKEAINDIKKNGKLHVFVTQENLQAFIPKLDKIESSRLREFLSDFDEVTIIGSSLRPDLDNDYSKRLFQVFKKLDIEPWTADDFLTYYDKLAQLSNYDKEQLENLKKSKNKIKAISQFTGGSPRLAVILSKLILEKNILDTAQLLDGIIDELTTYYQDITNDIPAKSKILFDMLIRKGENMTQSTLASSFEPPLEQKDIARSFAWLTDNYYVVSSKQARGNTKYFYVRDRLYVLYYQKRQVYADVPFSFVGVFVDFLNAFYSKREKVNELKRLDLSHAYALPVLSFMAQIEGLCLENSMKTKDIRDSLVIKYSGIPAKASISKQTNKRGGAMDDFALGNEYYSQNNFEKAIRSYEKAFSKYPEDADVYYNLGLAYNKQGEYEKAMKYFEKVINLNPESVDAFINLGIIYAKQGNYEKAISLFEKTLSIIPESIEANYNIGIVYSTQGYYEKAMTFYEKVLNIDNKDAAVYNNIGIVYYNNGDYEKAINSYKTAINLDPEYAPAYCNLGLAYVKHGDFYLALVEILKAVKLKPDDKDFTGLGLAILTNHQQWQFLNYFHEKWKGNTPFSSILGESLFRVIEENQNNKFFYFKTTFDAIRNVTYININEVINGLCIGLYKDGDMDFLRQVVDELSHDFADDAFVKINLEVYKYLLNPEGMDINQLHPDVRTVVNSIIKEE